MKTLILSICMLLVIQLSAQIKKKNFTLIKQQ